MAKKKTRKTQTIPTDESKADRFTRVVSPRVSKAVKAIGVIGFCAGSTYEFTPEQVVQINNVLEKAIMALRAKFESKPTETTSFEFTE